MAAPRERERGGVSRREARLSPGFLREGNGLCGHVLVEGFIELFLGCNPLCAVELEDGSHPDRVGLHTLVFRVLNLALDLDVSALLELGCELGQLAEDDEVVPFGALVILAGLFVLAGLLGGKGERGELLVVFAGANNCIAAEEAHEDYFVQVHDCVSVLKFPICSGHTWRSPASGSDSQGRSSAFTEGPSQMETVTEGGASRSRRTSLPPGVGLTPKQ